MHRSLALILLLAFSTAARADSGPPLAPPLPGQQSAGAFAHPASASSESR